MKQMKQEIIKSINSILQIKSVQNRLINFN